MPSALHLQNEFNRGIPGGRPTGISRRSLELGESSVHMSGVGNGIADVGQVTVSDSRHPTNREADMKRIAHMEYVDNTDKGRFIERTQHARNPVEVGVTCELPAPNPGEGPGQLVRVALSVFVDGTFEVSVGGKVAHVGAVS